MYGTRIGLPGSVGIHGVWPQQECSKGRPEVLLLTCHWTPNRVGPINKPTIGAMHHKHNSTLSYEASYMWEARHISKTYTAPMTTCHDSVQYTF